MGGREEAPAGATIVEGDLQDVTSLANAVEGVSAIVHLAAVFRTPDDDLIWRSDFDGTRHLIAAAHAHAPDARIIMASTSNVYNGDTPRAGREDDAADPKQAYPASKLAAEGELRASRLNWSILRFGFVYGDGDGHVESLPKYVASGQAKFHPAARMSMVHHRDIATAVNLELVGETMEPSAEPLPNPWHLHIDNTLARSLGLNPTVSTVHQAVHEEIM